MSLAVLIVYWIVRWERWARVVISVLVEWEIMILAPRTARPSEWTVRPCRASTLGLSNLSSGQPAEIKVIRVCSFLLVSWRICSRRWSVTKVASSRFVSSTSYRNLSSSWTWKIRWSGVPVWVRSRGSTARDNVSLTNIWGPGLYTTFKGYFCSLRPSRWSRLGLVKIGLAKIVISVLWSDSTWTMSFSRM